MLAIWVIVGLICSFVAKSKGRNQYLWFTVGVLFSVLGLLVLFLLPSLKKEKEPKTTPAGIKSMNSEAALPSEEEENFQPQSEPVMRIKPDSSLEWWYIYVSEEEKVIEKRGPMKVEDLRKEFVYKKLSISTYIWCDELADWTPLSEFENMSYLTDPELIIDEPARSKSNEDSQGLSDQPKEGPEGQPEGKSS